MTEGSSMLIGCSLEDVAKIPDAFEDYAEVLALDRGGLPGPVDICENVGADWLPFDPLYEVVTSRGRRSGAVSKEAMWRNAA